MYKYGYSAKHAEVSYLTKMIALAPAKVLDLMQTNTP